MSIAGLTASQSPSYNQNIIGTASGPQSPSGPMRDQPRSTIGQETAGSSTRSFMNEVQQTPILSAFGIIDEFSHQPGAQAGFFTHEIKEQMAKFPSLSERGGPKVSLLTPSWLQHLEDVYFNHVHHFFPFLRREDWHGMGIAQILTSGATDVHEDFSGFEASALCMVDMVYALGAIWSTRLDHQQSLAISERFFLAAKKLVTLDDLETPNLHLAQNLMLITQYCVTRTHRQRGYLHASLTYLSLVIRVCRSLKFPNIVATHNASLEELLSINIWRACLYFDV